MTKAESKKQFSNLFQSMTGRHSPWKIWEDMVWLFATTISNVVDGQYREEREQQYLKIAKQHSTAEMEKYAKMFAMLVDVYEGGWSDFLGELFMELELGNDHGGQFFTPYSVCKCMASISLPDITEKVEKAGYVSINDPACGAGATLIAAADIILNDYKINYQQHALFIGQDIDYTTALMCYIQLSLLGCAGYVRVGNTLTDPGTGHVLFGNRDANTWYTPMYYHVTWKTRRTSHILRNVFHREPRGEPLEEPAAVEETQAAPPEPETVDAPEIIQVGGKQAKQQHEGQLMFDL